MADGRLSLRRLVILLCLLYLQTTWADELNSDQDSRSYEVIGTSAGAASSSENGIEGSNYQHVGILHSRRQRRSAHIGHGVYHGHSHHRPVYVQHYTHPHHHGSYGHGLHSGGSNSHSQAHAISANFAGPYGNSGFSGAAASSGGGSNIGYGR